MAETDQAVTWRRGDGVTVKLPFALARAATQNTELLVELRLDEESVLGSVADVASTVHGSVILRQADGALLPVPVDMILEVRAPDVQTECTCGGEITTHVVVDGPHYPQLCASCKAELAETADRDERDDR